MRTLPGEGDEYDPSMPKLRDLEASFIRLEPDGQHYVDSMVGSHGVTFLCPLCFAKNLAERGDGAMGTHWVLCWWVGVDPALDPKPGRWTAVGTGLDDLTFVPGSGRSQSVALLSGCRWHGFVKDGSAD